MLEKFFDGLVDKEKITKDTIQEALKNVAKELNCDHKDFFIMIKADDEKMNFRCHIYKENKYIREITVKEIVSPPEEDE